MCSCPGLQNGSGLSVCWYTADNRRHSRCRFGCTYAHRDSDGNWWCRCQCGGCAFANEQTCHNCDEVSPAPTSTAGTPASQPRRWFPPSPPSLAFSFLRAPLSPAAIYATARNKARIQATNNHRRRLPVEFGLGITCASGYCNSASHVVVHHLGITITAHDSLYNLRGEIVEVDPANDESSGGDSALSLPDSNALRQSREITVPSTPLHNSVVQGFILRALPDSQSSQSSPISYGAAHNPWTLYPSTKTLIPAMSNKVLLLRIPFIAPGHNVIIKSHPSLNNHSILEPHSALSISPSLCTVDSEHRVCVNVMNSSHHAVEIHPAVPLASNIRPSALSHSYRKMVQRAEDKLREIFCFNFNELIFAGSLNSWCTVAAFPGGHGPDTLDILYMLVGALDLLQDREKILLRDDFYQDPYTYSQAVMEQFTRTTGSNLLISSLESSDLFHRQRSANTLIKLSAARDRRTVALLHAGLLTVRTASSAVDWKGRYTIDELILTTHRRVARWHRLLFWHFARPTLHTELSVPRLSAPCITASDGRVLKANFVPGWNLHGTRNAAAAYAARTVLPHVCKVFSNPNLFHRELGARFPLLRMAIAPDAWPLHIWANAVRLFPTHPSCDWCGAPVVSACRHDAAGACCDALECASGCGWTRKAFCDPCTSDCTRHSLLRPIHEKQVLELVDYDTCLACYLNNDLGQRPALATRSFRAVDCEIPFLFGSPFKWGEQPDRRFLWPIPPLACEWSSPSFSVSADCSCHEWVHVRNRNVDISYCYRERRRQHQLRLLLTLLTGDRSSLEVRAHVSRHQPPSLVRLASLCRPGAQYYPVHHLDSPEGLSSQWSMLHVHDTAEHHAWCTHSIIYLAQLYISSNPPLPSSPSPPSRRRVQFHCVIHYLFIFDTSISHSFRPFPVKSLDPLRPLGYTDCQHFRLEGDPPCSPLHSRIWERRYKQEHRYLDPAYTLNPSRTRVRSFERPSRYSLGEVVIVSRKLHERVGVPQRLRDSTDRTEHIELHPDGSSTYIRRSSCGCNWQGTVVEILSNSFYRIRPSPDVIIHYPPNVPIHLDSLNAHSGPSHSSPSSTPLPVGSFGIPVRAPTSPRHQRADSSRRTVAGAAVHHSPINSLTAKIPPSSVLQSTSQLPAVFIPGCDVIVHYSMIELRPASPCFIHPPGRPAYAHHILTMLRTGRGTLSQLSPHYTLAPPQALPLFSNGRFLDSGSEVVIDAD